MKNLEKKKLNSEVTKMVEQLGWGSTIQFIECVNGWASRYEARRNHNAQVIVYFNKYPKNLENKILFLSEEFNKILQKPFNLITTKWLCGNSSNRIPQKNTQDRFELYRSYSYVNSKTIECWKSGQPTWNNSLDIEEYIDTILDNHSLFKMMVRDEFNWCKDWLNMSGRSPWLKTWFKKTPLNEFEKSYKYNLLLAESFLYESISEAELYDRHYMIYSQSLNSEPVLDLDENLFRN